jgi:hypothetical protein
MEIGDEPVPTSLIALRAGDPIVQALKIARQEPLVILRVLPAESRSVALATPEIEATVRAHLARLADVVGQRRPAPRLVVRVGDPIEHVGRVAAETGARRVIAAEDFARRLSGTLLLPVITAEGVELGRRDVLAGIRNHLTALGRPVNKKLAGLRRMALFDGVSSSELQRLAAQLDVVEVGPGHVLIREGRFNDTLWVLLDGTAASSIRGREIGRLASLSLIGAPSMIYDEPAIATVITLQPIRALVASRAQFQVISGIDEVALRLKAATADRLREYLRAEDRATCSSHGLRLPAVAH